MFAPKKKIIIGTRGSPLALAQAEMARSALAEIAPNTPIELRIFVTQGDKKLDWSLEKTGGKGLFTSELENALVAGEIDVAVHSGKDLPTSLAAETSLAGCLIRAQANDVLITREPLGNGIPTKIATGSPRRRAQARALFPLAEFCELRGNIRTRLQKIATGDFAEATFLASAGLARLGISEFSGLNFRELTFEEMVPAAAQAAIALQTRSCDIDFFASACDAETSRAVAIERAFLSALGEGCHTAFAVHFSRNNLLLFHENIGRKAFPFAGSEDADISVAVANVIKKLGLGNA